MPCPWPTTGLGFGDSYVAEDHVWKGQTSTGPVIVICFANSKSLSCIGIDTITTYFCKGRTATGLHADDCSICVVCAN